jgi:ribosome-associated toxin RatA of RatAB toxin-antitoxin module
MHYRQCMVALVAALLILVTGTPAVQAASDLAITHKKDGKIQYVVGKIKIPHDADAVWMVLANPFEFEQKISPRFKTVQIITDKPDVSVLKCQVDAGFLLPPVHYTVESRYSNHRRIDFRSVAGDLKDFRGSWEIEPADGGETCYVTYSMYVEPNLPVPQWLVRQGIKIELPHTLNELRARVAKLVTRQDRPVGRKLASTGEVRFL